MCYECDSFLTKVVPMTHFQVKSPHGAKNPKNRAILDLAKILDLD